MVHLPGYDSISGLPLDKKLLESFGTACHIQKTSEHEAKNENTKPGRSTGIPTRQLASKKIEGKINLKIAAENVNGFSHDSNFEKRDTIFLRMWEKGDILFFQETHTTEETEKNYTSLSGDSYIFAHGQSNSKGVMIVISEKIEHEIRKKYRDPDGRFIIAICELQGYTFVLVNVYAPNKEKEHSAFLKKLREKMNELIEGEQYDFILAEGDWNFTEDNKMDRRGGNPKIWKTSLLEMQEIKDKYDLIDIYRTRNDEKRVFTHHSKRHGTYSRLDRFYVSDSLQNYVHSSTISPPILTDHSVVSIHIKAVEDMPQGPSFWRLNNDLLLDPNYVKQIRELIMEATNHPNRENDSWQNRYDYLKFKIKRHSIKISKQAAKKNRDEVNSLETSINALEAKLLDQPTNDKIKEQLSECQRKLEAHYIRIQRGKALQARTQCYEEGEKSTKFFLNQAKQNNRKSTIRIVKIGEGEHANEYTKPQDILLEKNFMLNYTPVE